MPNVRVARAFLAVLYLSLLALPVRALAQTLPSGPVTLAGGRLAISSQASASVGTNDDAYFNYSTYNYGLLRLFRLDGSADFTVNEYLSLLGDLRVLASTDSGHWLVRPYAAFVRVRPWPQRTIDIQAGLIPPVFGTFTRRSYDAENPLIGYPLAYQYLTSLRSDALPASIADVLRMRGNGWRSSYPIGASAPSEGVPLVDGIRYQTGIEARAGNLQPVEASVAWTAGSLSTPSLESGNGGKQVSGRIAVRPVVGLILGFSASQGTFVSRNLLNSLGTTSSGDQRALGFDAEYSWGHWLIRSEGIASAWRIPGLSDVGGVGSLRAFGLDFEGRYRILPGLYAAARFDRLTFSSVPAPNGATPWDFPVRRLEIGAGYSLLRNVLLKGEWQQNYREGSYDTTRNLVSAQLVVWF